MLIIGVSIILLMSSLFWEMEARIGKVGVNYDECEFHISANDSVPGVKFIEVRCLGDIVSFEQFFEALLQSDLMMDRLKGLLSFENGVFFECPPLTSDTLKLTPATFVLIPAADHDNSFKRIVSDASVFASHFDSCPDGKDVVSFHNLGRDAVLVSPCPSDRNNKAYGHLGVFARYATIRQFTDLWRLCVINMLEELSIAEAGDGAKKLWLSTHGLGVDWLHIRIDYRPKYYHYMPYKLA